MATMTHSRLPVYQSVARSPVRKGPKVFDRPMTSTSPKTSKALAGGIYRSDSVHEQVVTDRTCLVRVLLYLCTLVALAVTMVFAMPQAVWADEVQEPEAGTGATTHQELVADGDTRDTYEDVLGSITSTENTGRIWTDKSVSTESVSFNGTNEQDESISETVEKDENEDFLITYSALATSQQITQLPKVPVDVVFVLDFSGSMNWAQDAQEVTANTDEEAQAQSRLQAMVDALNDSIGTLVEDNNYNRIGIAVFNGTADILLPLTEASAIKNKVTDGNYLEITDFTIKEPTSAGGKREADATVTCNINDEPAQTDGGTNIQAGLDVGMSLLSNDENNTIYTYENQSFTRIPNVVLMSDGAPTSFSSATNAQWETDRGQRETGTLIQSGDDLYSVDQHTPVESGNWWDSLATDTMIGHGDTSIPHSADGFMALLMASYKKNQITDTYEANAAKSSAQNAEDAYCRVYTIGFSTSQQTPAMQEMVDAVLNPGETLKPEQESDVDAINEINEAWEAYSSGSEPKPTVYAELGGTNANCQYVVAIPEDDPANPTSLNYPDEYFSAENAEDLNDAFQQITNAITESAKAPTEVEGGNPAASGYITYSDPIGEYMHVSDVKTLIWAGQRFDRTSDPVKSGTETTYTFEGSIESPVYGTHSVSEIQIKVTTDGNGNQTLEVKIPASAIPLRVNHIEVNADGTVESNEASQVYPLRLIYSVSLNDGVLNADGTVNTDTETGGVSEDYLAENTNTDGSVNFYTNRFDGIGQPGKDGNSVVTVGNAYVEYTPAADNPFYFFQENTPIYTSEDGDGRVEKGSFDENASYWVPVSYYDGKTVVDVRVERAASTIADYISYEQVDGANYAYIKAGSPRLGNLMDFIEIKGATGNGSSNNTMTAESYRYPSYVEGDQFHIYQGNNGRLTVDGPATLTISKNVVSADEGLAIPADVAETAFRFELTVEDFAGQTVPAVIRTEGESTGDADGDGQPDAASPTEETIWLHFDEAGNATVVGDETATDPGAPIELKADQLLIVSQMAGKAYSVQEVVEASEGEDGYIPPVDFELQSAEIVAPGESGDVDTDDTLETVVSTVGTVDMTVAFVNVYNPSVTLDADAALSVVKNLKGTDLSGAESDPNNFEFTITPTASADGSTTAEEAASKIGIEIGDGQPVGSLVFRNDVATMTDGVATDTMSPFANGLRFDAHDVGKTFTYTVDEVEPANPVDGYEYDGDTHTVAYTVSIDPATGQLAVAMTVDGQSVTAPEEEGTPVPTVEFNNAYHETTLDLDTVFGTQVTKELQGRDDVPLKAGEFEFKMTVTANDGSSLNGVSPTEATAKNNADRTVDFGNITFKNEGTYTVEIQEVVPENPEPFVTYDSHKYSYTVTVTYDEDTNTLNATPSNPQVVTYNPETETYIDVTDVLEAATFVNTYEAEQEKTVSQEPDGADAPIDMNGQTVGVGDELTYTINWKNTAVDAITGKAVEASIVVRDSVPAGTEYIEDSWMPNDDVVENGFKFEGDTLEWDLGKQPAGASGTITFKVRITDVSIEEAIEAGELDESNVIVANNQATVSINNDDNPTTEVTNYIPTKQVNGDAEADGIVQVSDVLTYTVSYRNTDPNVPSTVHIEDTLSKGLEFVGMAENFEGLQPTDPNPKPNENGETVLTWDIPNVAPATGGTISYKVRVTEDAVTVDDLTNTATITVGKDSVVTNTPVVKAMSGDLSISKTVQRADGEELSAENAAQQFHFIVRLTDAHDAALVGTYQATGFADGATELSFAADEAAGKEAGTATFTLTHDQTVTIHGLPVGAKYTVEEVDIPAGYAPTNNNPMTGTIAADVDGSGVTVPVTVGFTNVYNTETFDGAANLTVTKVVEGDFTWKEGTSFTFTLTGADAATQEAIANGTVVLPDNADGIAIAYNAADPDAPHTASFGDITFKAAGDYLFAITEQQGDIAGMTYDVEQHLVSVAVTDNGDGTLAVVPDADTVNPTITNTYEPTEAVLSGAGNLTVTKNLVGRDWQEGDSFTFVLEADMDDETTADAMNDGAIRLPGNAGGITVAFDANDPEAAHSASFGDIAFTRAGTYRFTVTELAGSIDGVVYDTAAHEVVVTVVDNGDGTLGFAADGVVGANPTVTNVFTAPIDYSARSEIVISKTLDGRPATDGQFSFTVTPADEASALKLDIPEGGYTLSTPAAGDGEKATVNLFATLLGEGKVPVTFTSDDAGTTFSYTVTENGTAPAGYTYDASVYTVDITVTDDPNAGGLTVTTQVSDGAGYTMMTTVTNATEFAQPVEIPFVNSYRASTDVEGGAAAVVNGTKELVGTAMREFSFVLEGVAGTNTEGYVNTAVNDGTSFSFTLDYDQDSFTAGAIADENGNRSEDFVYTLHEVGAGEVKGGITYDDARYRATVTVADNGDGTMAASVTKLEQLVVDEAGTESWIPADAAAFTNTYAAATSVSLDVDKVLSGRDMTAADSYEFVAYAYDRATQTIDRTGLVATGSTPAGQTAADGAAVGVEMSTIEYTVEGLNADAATPWVDVTDEYGQPTGVRTKTYDYAIEEVVGADLNVSYAPEVFYAQVVVTDDGQGNLRPRRPTSPTPPCSSRWSARTAPRPCRPS